MKRAGKDASGRATRPSGATDPAAVAGPLLAWYARARRDLPWRRSRDPYRVWVSEIMLQQTQVERVKDFFVRFLDRFPTVTALAAAAEHDVLRSWEGLGYYRRARQLHAAARIVVEEHGGKFPRTAAALRTLPGIGRYTAGAVASIAFDRREPIVEANSRRVIARLAGHDGPLDGPRGDEPIWRIAAALVPARQAGRFNQALMDLGALVCTPERPLCPSCPLAACCMAYASGRTAEIPAKAPRRKVAEIRETAVVVRRAGRVLVVRRTPGEWWEGLWDFPRLAGAAGAVRRGIARSPLMGGLGCGPPERLGTISHTVTHHKVTLDVVICAASALAASAAGRPVAGRRWMKAAALKSLAMTAPGRRIARMLTAAGRLDSDSRAVDDP
ncbi:MAG: A/G-specific adenine glycosylase [Planctomycetia bacterium]